MPWSGHRQPRGGVRRAAVVLVAFGAMLVAAVAIAGALGRGPLGSTFRGGDETSILRLPRGAFVPSDSGRRAVIWAVGDGADGGPSARRVATLIAGSPGRLLYLGDVYQSGSASDFARHYVSTYGRLASRTAPTPGNHDWPQHLEGYDPYWRRIVGRPPPAFYAFRMGGWEIISLNSEGPHSRGSAQDRWLRRQVQRSGTCRLAFWHRPRYSAGVEHGDEPDVQPFWDALRGRATLIVNGHEHDMQRFRPVGGLTQLIAGAGGHDRYAIRRHAGVAFSNASDYGALRLGLSPGSARWSFVAVDGRVLDRGRVSCREG